MLTIPGKMPGKHRVTPRILQTNIQRLMSRCQDLVDAKGGTIDNSKIPLWKLKKYVSVLESGIMELEEGLQKNTLGIDKELVKTLKLRRDILKQLVEAKAKVIQEERASTEGAFSTQISQVSQISLDHTTPTSSLENQVSEREELFGTVSDSGPTHRLGHVRGLETDIEKVVQKHKELQDQIAEDMLTSIRALKNNTLVAKGTIEGDADVLDQAAAETDKNIGNLKQETGRLQQYGKTSCPWGVMLMLVVVFCLFLGMVLFIKIT